uniref:Uncharacterized protein n=1 Tax=uncultured marine group II/III euryarchaeote KM3_194_G04 TaxID=1457969 RepID=A0A075GSD7_9EURY|nr:hypothetical protein [uncultured marine group II/III euryarchaeote KM3_194_G04]
MLVYTVNFIFFADCHVINGTGCTSILTSGAAEDHSSYGRGAGFLNVAGCLMLGLFMGNLLMLNEGARAKWSLMIPGLIGFVVLTLVLAVTGDYEAPSDNPMIAAGIATLLYGAAYYFLIEEGVNEGLDFGFNGIQVKDSVATGLLLVAALIGVFFAINNLFFAESYLGRTDGPLPTFGNYADNYYANEPTAPAPIVVKVLGALIIPYTLFAVNILRTGASGKWPIMHVSMFGLGAFAVNNVFGTVFFDDAEWAAATLEATRAAFIQNTVISLFVWFAVVYGYYRLRDEGAEDGMTIMGEPAEDKDFFMFKMYPMVMAVIAVVILSTHLYSFSGLD